MAEVRAALIAVHLNPAHTKIGVFILADVFRFLRRPEAWPPGAGIELGFRAEEFGAATGAAIQALVLAVPVFTGERALSAVLAGDTKFLRC